MANAHLRGEEDIRKGIARADFVRKGTRLYLSHVHVRMSQAYLVRVVTTYRAAGRPYTRLGLLTTSTAEIEAL